MDEFEKIRLSRIANCLALRGASKINIEYIDLHSFFIKKYDKINKDQ